MIFKIYPFDAFKHKKLQKIIIGGKDSIFFV